ncbi:MAG TPA: hypothetical protein VG326_04130 [Tepidisphaeraceae bacterium]|nr:hypothetical protein [Tepidisphaeraceae bacterium]
MSQINPLNYALVQRVQTQRDAAVERERQLRREHPVRKAGAQEDTFEHQVEGAEQVQPIKDEAEHDQQDNNPHPHHGANREGEDDPAPHLDLTA